MEPKPREQHKSDTSHFNSLGDREWEKLHYGDERPCFIKGLDLCEAFFRDQVEPIIRRTLPHLKIAAGRIDYGSDVLGYDTELSRDHAWGPQVTLYLAENDIIAYKDHIDSTLQEQLPRECLGYSTRMSRDLIWHPTRDANGHHRVRIESVRSFFQNEIGFLPSPQMSTTEWLSLPAQKLRVFTSGRVFVDELLELSSIREGMRWYPHDLWLHLMAVQWQKLFDRAPFAGRCAHVGDMWGAADNVSGTFRNLVHLCYLLEQKYPPYTKWLGTGLKELSLGSELITLAERARLASSWPEQEDAIVEAYQLVANRHNKESSLPRVSTEVTTYYSRPYRMVDIEGIVRTLRETIRDERIRELSLLEGAVWQLVDLDAGLYNNAFPTAYRQILESKLLR